LIRFSLPGVDGKTHSTGDFGDSKLLVVIFTCNHCPYARAYTGRIRSLRESYTMQELAILAINPNDAERYPEDAFSRMPAMAAAMGLGGLYLGDESQDVARQYSAGRTPEVFLFDQNRQLQYHGAIDDHWEYENNIKHPYLRSAIDALLKGETPKIRETPAVGCTIKWKPES